MEHELQTIAGLMAVAARTAPKTKGEDFLEIKVVSGRGINELAEAMEKFGRESGLPNFDRDGENVRRSGAVLIISLLEPAVSGLDCGACGYDTCAELSAAYRNGSQYGGPICSFRLIDLGIALGSAAKTASLFNADSRIMYRIGVSALRAGLARGDMAIGIPLSATGKSIYFDRS